MLVDLGAEAYSVKTEAKLLVELSSVSHCNINNWQQCEFACADLDLRFSNCVSILKM